jgi:hypothetical protein
VEALAALGSAWGTQWQLAVHSLAPFAKPSLYYTAGRCPGHDRAQHVLRPVAERPGVPEQRHRNSQIRAAGVGVSELLLSVCQWAQSASALWVVSSIAELAFSSPWCLRAKAVLLKLVSVVHDRDLTRLLVCASAACCSGESTWVS